MNQQKDIIRKIKALQERTMQNGCSEEEAIQAANMIDKLLLKYNLSLSDIHIKETDCDIKYIKTGTKRMPSWICGLANACAQHYDTKLLFTGSTLQFFGMPEDVEAATALYIMLKAATDRAAADYTCSYIYRKARAHESARGLTSSFRYGMAGQLDSRLREMKKELEVEIKSQSGTALVALKADKVEKDILAAFPNLKTSTRKCPSISNQAFGMGQDAADAYSFNKAVEGE